MSWQRANIQAAVTYLREHMKGDVDPRIKVVYEGLIEVLEPARRTIRLQREAAEGAKASVPVAASRERRHRVERRGSDRRIVNLGPPAGTERRKNPDRRAGADRRQKS
jgi:hypothetical protein